MTRALSHRQRLALEALVAGQTKREAAIAGGVQPATVGRWLRDPLFRAALAEAQGQVLGDTTRRMASGARDMLTVLDAVAQDKGVSPGVRVRAALGWLGHLWRAQELHELAERIAALEARMGDRSGGVSCG